MSKEENGANISFVQLVEAVRHNDYQLMSGKTVMDLPVYFKLGESIISSYKEFYDKYERLIESQGIEKDIQDFVKALCDGLEETIKTYLNGDIFSSNKIFEETMEPIRKNDILPRCTLDKKVLYRKRSDEGIANIEDFKHIPFNKLYLSKSERFSIEGYPVLYLGYSKQVCDLEIPNGTLACFNLKSSINNIVDLTLGQGDGIKALSDIDLIKVYPLIASCYVVPYYSILTKKECKPKNLFFREEYIIPQLLTAYIKEKYKAKGIIYYSVKDPNLQTNGTGENDLRNVALYTSRNNEDIYDKALMDKFEIKI